LPHSVPDRDSFNPITKQEIEGAEHTPLGLPVVHTVGPYREQREEEHRDEEHTKLQSLQRRGGPSRLWTHLVTGGACGLIEHDNALQAWLVRKALSAMVHVQHYRQAVPGTYPCPARRTGSSGRSIVRGLECTLFGRQAAGWV
jgi:hypothetical protein